ncbi:hypothetical protein CDAR_288921 [Caerostris darwini]|uniref:Uncharacterized protein n=1 Tax=Caerostris darwini TaxID=1538125 RepID=A0AAV4Q6U7_9ARAC|nr:hypothetical protein CDAR_288921 [Caerostris darwini]
MLLKEAAAPMIKVQKHQRAANIILSPTWEKASLTIEECSQRIRAICTYIGAPASHLPTKKELSELNKAKELRDQIAAEAAQTVTAVKTALTPALPQQQQGTTPTPKRKTPPSLDADDEGFKTVISKKEKKRVSTRTQPSTFTSRSVQPTVAFSEILRQGNEAKSVGRAPQPIMVRKPLPAATTNSSAPVSALLGVFVNGDFSVFDRSS